MKKMGSVRSGRRPDSGEWFVEPKGGKEFNPAGICGGTFRWVALLVFVTASGNRHGWRIRPGPCTLIASKNVELRWISATAYPKTLVEQYLLITVEF